MITFRAYRIYHHVHFQHLVLIICSKQTFNWITSLENKITFGASLHHKQGEKKHKFLHFHELICSILSHKSLDCSLDMSACWRHRYSSLSVLSFLDLTVDTSSRVKNQLMTARCFRRQVYYYMKQWLGANRKLSVKKTSSSDVIIPFERVSSLLPA